MELRADHALRRLVLAARTPGLDAGRLQAVAGCSADLELLERPDSGPLTALGLTTPAPPPRRARPPRTARASRLTCAGWKPPAARCWRPPIRPTRSCCGVRRTR